MHVFDPMHDLMLVTVKHTFNIWLETGVLSPNQFLLIGEWKRRLKLPSDIGRIPHKLSKAYKSMKSNKWKHWTLVCSMFSLLGIMSQHDLNIWCLFVNDCHILCRQVIILNETDEAHKLLNIFCDHFQQEYGTENCVANMTFEGLYKRLWFSLWILVFQFWEISWDFS